MSLRVMVIGSGGREHALAWKISLSPMVGDILCVPGNAGILKFAECVNADISDIDSLVKIARERQVDLTVVGPEAPLVAGIVDEFESQNLTIFGPTASAAKIEGSKDFSKKLMVENEIPTGKAKTFSDYEEAKIYLESLEPPIVVKADGLAAGKGVTVAFDRETAIRALSDCLVNGVFGESGEKVIVEEYLEGQEVSILSISDGLNLLHMVPSQDHKRAYDNDRGPNTGGMGAYSPVPFVDSETEKFIHERIMEATIHAMSEKGIPYKGVLYGGLILTSDGPKVLEFNVRFGDPETQAVVPRLKSDLLPALLSSIDGRISEVKFDWSDEYCVCVVIASGGYPGKYETGFPIKGLKAASSDSKVEIFHAGTKIEDGKVVTAGGRVLNVVALGSDIEEARGLAYEAVQMISFEGMHYRKDIGLKALEG